MKKSIYVTGIVKDSKNNMEKYLFSENERLNAIIDELEEWLNLEISIHDEDDTIDTLYSCVLNKIQELKKKYK